VLIFRLSTKFGAKILIDAEIMAKKEIQDGGNQGVWGHGVWGQSPPEAGAFL